ncbi:MAG: hypothetical protein ABI868_15205 [Acidobacteriota bacterium]
MQKASWIVIVRVALAALVVALPSIVSAAERYAVVITGAAGGSAYAEKYNAWRTALVTLLTQKLGYPGDRLFVLAESESENVRSATGEHVRDLFAALRRRLAGDDTLFVFLIGHGTADNEEAKFNLVGPDLTSSEWARLLQPVPGRLVFIDTTGGSFPFMQRLAAPGRVVVTATDTPAQQFDTIFPDFLVKAFDDGAADADKNGRVSIWEAFSHASAGVRQWFERNGQLATERPLLDDDGDGAGREAQNPGADGTLARTIFLAAESTAAGGSQPAKRRAELERQLDDLRQRKASSRDPGQYDAEIEKILVEIARLSREIGAKP